MSKHNYTQYSNHKKHDNTADAEIPVSNQNNVFVGDVVPEVDDAVTTVAAPVEPAEIKMVNKTVETVTLPKSVTGVVDGCMKLNVRVEPAANADVICTLSTTTEVEINVDDSTAEWFKVCTATGVDGYCMRKFIKATL